MIEVDLLVEEMEMIEADLLVKESRLMVLLWMLRVRKNKGKEYMEQITEI